MNIQLQEEGFIWYYQKIRKKSKLDSFLALYLEKYMKTSMILNQLSAAIEKITIKILSICISLLAKYFNSVIYPSKNLKKVDYANNIINLSMLPFIILMLLVIWSIILHLATSQTLLLHRWTYNQTIFLLFYWSIFLINISTIERKELHFSGYFR